MRIIHTSKKTYVTCILKHILRGKQNLKESEEINELCIYVVAERDKIIHIL
jgi:hypothetical protein